MDKADNFWKEVATDDLTNLRELIGKRLDLIVAEGLKEMSVEFGIEAHLGCGRTTAGTSSSQL